jgi:hypothetical protein
MEEQTHDIMLKKISFELDKSWINMTPWRLCGLKEDQNAVVGHYQIDIEKDLNPAAPHFPLLHGTVMYTIATYQTIIGMCFFVANKLDPSFTRLPDVPFPELRRRIIIASSSLSFKTAILSPDVVMKMTLENCHDKYDKKKMIFANIAIDVNAGSQLVTSSICLNFRDELIPKA